MHMDKMGTAYDLPRIGVDGLAALAGVGACTVGPAAAVAAVLCDGGWGGVEEEKEREERKEREGVFKQRGEQDDFRVSNTIVTRG